ncbi:hypothetical protein MRS44_004221 [Fusarium solani]|uniref:uncharacterized protein n=1 Tax=Fusarium solani TaxID=169388 RepID=UPI0032C3E552|nr:hypothetical protein MRS44_004221 [Fusarium solani]
MSETTQTYVGTAQQGLVINPKTLDMALNAGHAAKEARKKGANDKDATMVYSKSIKFINEITDASELLNPWLFSEDKATVLGSEEETLLMQEEVRTCEINTSNINEAEVETLGSNAQEFPATEEQDTRVKNTFIESLDLDAICALALRLGQYGPEWVVRVPIEPILGNPWDKVLSEVATIEKYMAYQFGLVSGFFSPPVSNHTVDDIKQEIFALRCMERIFEQVIDPQLDKGPFVLNHLDLRGPNIIVDKNLRIQGIVDWEFAHTVPRQVFTPPSWITGHDSIETNKQMHAEFRSVLDENRKANGLWEQLGKEWYGQSADGKTKDQTDMAFCVVHVLRRPADATEIFEDFLAEKLLDKSFDDAVSEFFKQSQAAALEAQRRAEECERYREYLRENGLYETETDKLLAESKALKAKWGWE